MFTSRWLRRFLFAVFVLLLVFVMRSVPQNKCTSWSNLEGWDVATEGSNLIPPFGFARSFLFVCGYFQPYARSQTMYNQGGFHPLTL